MGTLLIVHHTVSPATRMLYESVLEGTRAATDEGVTGVEVASRPALSASAAETLDASGVVLGTPANIGYMAGAMKHFFDTIYYPLLDATRALPYGLYLHGNEDTTGARRAVESITGALGWQPAVAPVVVMGEPSADDRDACWNLGATLTATVGD